jgi:hypothetical protein
MTTDEANKDRSRIPSFIGTGLDNKQGGPSARTAAVPPAGQTEAGNDVLRHYAAFRARRRARGRGRRDPPRGRTARPR